MNQEQWNLGQPVIAHREGVILVNDANRLIYSSGRQTSKKSLPQKLRAFLGG
jgi:hypothetical protein